MVRNLDLKGEHMITKNNYSMYGLDSVQGLSTDTKPTDVPENTLFLELDTNKFYYFANGGWAEVGTEAPTPQVHYSVTISSNAWIVEPDFGYIKFTDPRSAGLVAGNRYSVAMTGETAEIKNAFGEDDGVQITSNSYAILDNGDSTKFTIYVSSAPNFDTTITIDSVGGGDESEEQL